MPLPTPNSKEKQNDFVSRCMSNSTMKKEYPNNDQRLAVCFSQYKRAKKKAKGAEPKWEDQDLGSFTVLL